MILHTNVMLVYDSYRANLKFWSTPRGFSKPHRRLLKIVQTRLYESLWNKTAGTPRFVQNAAGWLMEKFRPS